MQVHNYMLTLKTLLVASSLGHIFYIANVVLTILLLQDYKSTYVC